MDILLAQNPIRVAIEGALEPGQLLEALNEGSSRFVRRYVQQHFVLEQLSDKSLGTLVDAAVTVTTQLRMYVSAWIDTGRKPGGEEQPLDRRLQAAPGIHDRLAAFHRDYPISTRIDQLGDPGQMLICDVGCYGFLRGDRQLPGAARQAAMVWAQSFFLALLLSPWKHRICLCRRCGTFLLLARAPRKRGYVRGVHCEACASAASAVAITTRNRSDATEVLMMFAAKQCSALHCHCNPEIIKQRALSIAEKVTTNLGNHSGTFYREKRIGKRTCTRKWVVTHAAALAKEQQRLEAERSLQRARGRSKP